MNAQHTPGPWHTGTGRASRIVYAEGDGYAVADATVYHTKRTDEQAAANAALIAAAPELLAALIVARRALDTSKLSRDEWAQIDKALAAGGAK